MFKEEEVLDFEKHIIPQFLKDGRTVSAYEWNGYYRDIPTAEDYWKANLELTVERPELSFYEKFWTIYTKGENLAPAYIADSCNVRNALLSEGSEVYGRVEQSVIGPGTVVSEGAVVRNSVIQEDCFVARGAVVQNAVIARGSTIGSGAVIGAEDGGGICVIGEDSIIPDGAVVHKQTEKNGGKEGDRL
jgi:glucose-1-phosphate adenylyltransferase